MPTTASTPSGGAIPLSIGYAAILGQALGVLFAWVLPPVMLGRLTVIASAGTLNFVAEKYPHQRVREGSTPMPRR